MNYDQQEDNEEEQNDNNDEQQENEEQEEEEEQNQDEQQIENEEQKEDYEQFANLNTNNEQVGSRYTPGEIKKLLKQFKEIFESYFKDQNFNSFICEKEKEEGVEKISTTFAQEKYFDEVLILTNITIIPSQSKFEVFSYFCRFDGEPYMIGEKYLRLLLGRYLARLNATIRFGCFSIDPMHGIIKLKMSSILSDDVFDHIVSLSNYSQEQQEVKKEAFNKLITFMHSTSHFSISFHIYRLLHMVNVLSKRVMDYLDERLKDQYRNINLESQKHLDNIFDILKNKTLMPYDSNEYPTYKPYLEYPRIQSVQGNDRKIISTINITSPISEVNKQLIPENQKGTGGFSLIYQIGIRFKMENNEIVSRYIVLKKSRGTSDQRSINHEKKILTHLSTNRFTIGECVFIEKFYRSEQPDFQDYLFMDLCMNGSLDNFRIKFQTTQSLNTKLFILYQIAMGIKFLKDNKVYHVDIKPGNILITKNYVAKITDFGESFCADQSVMSQQDINNYHPGRTLPYAAPELDERVYQEKLDIFSFGMMMSEYIFEELPVDYMKNNLQELQTQYRERRYQIKLNEDYVKQQGPKHLMKFIRTLILQCLKPHHKERPQIEWIIIILREALCYIEKMY